MRPVITPKKFQDTKLIVGDNVEFEAFVEGYPSPTVEWLKDSTPIKKSNKKIKMTSDKLSHKLSINTVTIDEAGEYKIVAKNKIASVSFAADLTIEPKPSPPEFITELKNTEVSDMDPVVFEVEVKNCDKLSWYLDDLAISDDEDYEFSQDGDKYSYKIISVNPEDSGKYECRATNKHGTTSSSCQLTVNEIEALEADAEDGKMKDPVPVIQTDVPEEAMEKMEGDRFEVSFAIAGEPTPEVFFYKDDDPLEDSERVEIAKEGNVYNFIIEALTLEDAGLYVVEVEGATGLVEKEFEIKVSGMFKFKNLKVDFHLKINKLRRAIHTK